MGREINIRGREILEEEIVIEVVEIEILVGIEF
jgi:hypothetical protein